MKVTVAGKALPTAPSRVVTIADSVVPQWFLEVTGPAEAFEMQTRGAHDFVKIIKPELVQVERYQRI